MLILASVPAYAGVGYGVYDARTLGMGGTSVASASNANALFYNASLLAYNEEIEERTRDSRVLLPIIAPQLSRSTLNIERIASDALPADLGDAVAAFNDEANELTAQAVVDASLRLENRVRPLADEDVFGDVYLGLAISEPGKRQGAGFFLGLRALGAGAADITDTDLDLLAAYREGLRFVASNGVEGTPQPQLFAPGGALIDPNDDFESTVEATGLTVLEVGVAMSTQTEVRGHSLAAGIAFKMQDVRTFEDIERLVEDRLDIDRNQDDKVRFNVDLGLSTNVGERWRLGLAVKDAIPYDYETSLGTRLRMRPRSRLGAAYQRGRLQLAADVDLNVNEPLGAEAETQELATGVEWLLAGRSGAGELRVRAGLRSDLRGNRDEILSLGAGVVWKRLAVDAAYAQGEDARALALQFGVVF